MDRRARWDSGPARHIGMAFAEGRAGARIGEPDAAIGVGRNIIGGIQVLALEPVGYHGHGAVQLPAYHAAEIMLAGKLTALEIEAIAVAVVGRLAERHDLAGLPDVAILGIALHIAEQKIYAFARPRGAFGPKKAGAKPCDRRIAYDQPVEAVVEGNVHRGREKRPAAHPFPIAGAAGSPHWAECRVPACPPRVLCRPPEGPHRDRRHPSRPCGGPTGSQHACPPCFRLRSGLAFVPPLVMAG